VTKRNPERWEELVQRVAEELVQRVAKDQHSEELNNLTDQIAAVLRENSDAKEASIASEQVRPSGRYAGLPNMEGVCFGSYASAKQIACPFCSSGEAALLATAPGSDRASGLSREQLCKVLTLTRLSAA
jgi:hypothetical protein